MVEQVPIRQNVAIWNTLAASRHAREPRFELALAREKSLEALTWRMPRVVAVDPKTDLFHFDVPTDYISHLFGVMAYCRKCTFLVSTKRPHAMAGFLNRYLGSDPVDEILNEAGLAPDFLPAWPLSNVWLGFDASTQKAVDEGITHLRQCPAAVRLLNLQPLLEAVRLPFCEWPSCGCPPLPAPPGKFDPACPKSIKRMMLGNRDIHWVIAGGAQGRHARPTHPDWFRAIRDQCHAARVPFFFSQWGEWAPSEFGAGQRQDPPQNRRHHYFDDPPCKVWRFGKEAAGRLLDGRTWDEMPRVD